MKYQECDISLAKGIRLVDTVRLPNRILKKGRRLNDEDVEELKKIGISRIFGVEMGSKDLSFQSALGIIAAKLCGNNAAYCVNDDGVARIVAAEDGIFEASDDRIAKFNRMCKPFILNTIEVYHKVKAGEVIADLSVSQPVLTQSQVDEVVYKLSGNVEMLKVATNLKHKVALIYTNFYNDKAEKAHFTRVVKKLIKEYSDLGLEFVREYTSNHDSQSLGDTLEQAFRDHNDIIFIIPALRTSCSQDVIPTALRSIVDDIISESIPKVGASDLIIAQKKERKIISLPFAYDEINSHLLHRYILQAVVSTKLLAYSFEHPQNVFLNASEVLDTEACGKMISSSGSNNANGQAVAAVVLAAGVSKRACYNKLLAEVDGEPLFMKAVHAAVKSKANPVFVVTGYQNEEVENALENVDVNIVYNPDFRSGVKTSINLGLKTVPSFCSGAFLIPADMPNISEAQLNKMIESFVTTKKQPQVLITSYQDTKYNPVLWSRDLFAKAEIIPEDSSLREVLLDVADFCQMVEVKNKKAIVDITFPNDVNELIKNRHEI